MTDRKGKRRRLSTEILLTFALCFVLSVILFILLTSLTVGLVEEYCFYNDIELTEDDYFHLDTVVLGAGFVLSVLFFTVLFLALFGEKLGYIRTVIAGVEAMRMGEAHPNVPLKGNNELTELAESVNYLAETQREVKDAEEKLRREKEELIRSLSHDIRTPLTSIMSYTQLLSAKENVTPEETAAYLSLVSRKTAHIKELTDLLLDGGHREMTVFEDARLLLLQLCEEFGELLEEDFTLSLDVSALPPFTARLDVAELRRIFDNLASNIGKYADPASPVTLTVSRNEKGLVICQSNAIAPVVSPAESHRMGLIGIRRIAQSYGGGMEAVEEGNTFSITVTLANLG